MALRNRVPGCQPALWALGLLTVLYGAGLLIARTLRS